MVVSSNYNLIPYPDHHYPIQPYISENALAICLTMVTISADACNIPVRIRWGG
jgi:hypothetical protein